MGKCKTDREESYQRVSVSDGVSNFFNYDDAFFMYGYGLIKFQRKTSVAFKPVNWLRSWLNNLT